MTENITAELSALTILLIPLFATAAVTAIIEVTFWFCCRFRDFKFLIFIALINIFTNLAANIYFLFIKTNFSNILIAEISVILTEYALIQAYPKKQKKLKIFIFTVFANLISYLSGVIYFSLFK